MKKIILFTILLILSANSFSQQTIPSQPLNRADYLKKSKNQKTAGWILLTGGTIMAVGGAISFGHNYNYGSNTATDISGFLLLGGIVSAIVSIPFFISSSKNKKKAAASVSFKMENATNIYQLAVANIRYPAVAIQIRL